MSSPERKRGPLTTQQCRTEAQAILSRRGLNNIKFKLNCIESEIVTTIILPTQDGEKSAMFSVSNTASISRFINSFEKNLRKLQQLLRNNY